MDKDLRKKKKNPKCFLWYSTKTTKGILIDPSKGHKLKYIGLVMNLFIIVITWECEQIHWRRVKLKISFYSGILLYLLTP